MSIVAFEPWEEARGVFFAWVQQQYENFVEYRFEGSAPREEMTVSFAPTWLPDGYEERKVESSEGTLFHDLS